MVSGPHVLPIVGMTIIGHVSTGTVAPVTIIRTGPGVEAHGVATPGVEVPGIAIHVSAGTTATTIPVPTVVVTILGLVSTAITNGRGVAILGTAPPGVATPGVATPAQNGGAKTTAHALTGITTNGLGVAIPGLAGITTDQTIARGVATPGVATPGSAVVTTNRRATGLVSIATMSPRVAIPGVATPGVATRVSAVTTVIATGSRVVVSGKIATREMAILEVATPGVATPGVVTHVLTATTTTGLALTGIQTNVAEVRTDPRALAGMIAPTTGPNAVATPASTGTKRSPAFRAIPIGAMTDAMAASRTATSDLPASNVKNQANGGRVSTTKHPITNAKPHA
jgi:hypothetical protein